ncbi:MAG: hypothetical protein RLZZ387_5085 [Chloroflexota bacterium]
MTSLSNARTVRAGAVRPPLLPAVALLLAHLALAPQAPMELRGLAAHLALMLPGALLALLLFRDEPPLARAFLALCGAVALPPLVLLPIHALPGPIPWWAPLLASDALSLWLLWLLGAHGPRTTDRRRTTADERRWSSVLSPRAGVALAAVLLLGAALRLAYLSGAEFQGDEGRAILMAADALHGADDVLLLHKKGPVEVLLPLGPLAVTGQINELIARLPFALAGVGALLGAFLLGREIAHAPAPAAESERPGDMAPFAPLAGLITALTLALDGFMIGFSRIVQYQSVLVLVTCGAIYLAWRFYAGAPHPRRTLLCAAALAAVGLLAHYDAIWALPALAFLVLAGARRRRWSAGAWLAQLLPPVLLAAGLLASFFVPFALHERFARTLDYLAGRTGQGDAAISLYNNLPYYAQVSTFYNTTFAMATLGALLACGLAAWLVAYVRPRPLGALLAAPLAAGVALTALAPERLQLGEELNVAVLLFGLPLAALALAPRTPPGPRAAVLWFAAGLVAKAFLVARPNTHFYVMHPGAALLVGLTCAQLWRALRDSGPLGRLAAAARPLLIAGGVGVLLLAAPYAYILLVRQEPEYRRTFPEHRPDIFRAGYGDDVPRFANFGFPHRAGWKVTGELYARGVIGGSYIANEEELITGWYMRGAFRCPINADYVLLATHPLDRVRLDEREVRDTYHLLGIVTTDGVGKMEIWSRAPLGTEPRAFELRELEAAFDARPVAGFPTQRSLAEVTPQHRLGATWPGDVRLVGYDLEPAAASPRQPATLTLYWRTPLAPESPGTGYEPRVELVDAAGRVAGLAEPTCDPPSAEWHWQWLSGVSYRLPADLAPGAYTLRVSLRDPAGAALPQAAGDEALDIGGFTWQ